MSKFYKNLIETFETIYWCQMCKYENCNPDGEPCVKCACDKFIKWEMKGVNDD